MKNSMINLKSYLVTISGATCWGLIGLLIDPLYAYGLTHGLWLPFGTVFPFMILILITGS